MIGLSKILFFDWSVILIEFYRFQMSWLEGIEDVCEEVEPPECCHATSISQISDEIFLGDDSSPSNLCLLNRYGITHVLSLVSGNYDHYPHVSLNTLLTDS